MSMPPTFSDEKPRVSGAAFAPTFTFAPTTPSFFTRIEAMSESFSTPVGTKLRNRGRKMSLSLPAKSRTWKRPRSDADAQPHATRRDGRLDLGDREAGHVDRRKRELQLAAVGSEVAGHERLDLK